MTTSSNNIGTTLWIENFYLGWPQFCDLFTLIKYINPFFCWSLCLLAIVLGLAVTVTNLIYKVINLSFIGLIVVLMWQSAVGNNAVFTSYILAYVGAVVLFIMGVVMMLPASAASANPGSHFVFFLPFIGVAKVLSLVIYPCKLLVTAFAIGWACELLVFGGLVMYALFTFHKHVNNRSFPEVIKFLWRQLPTTLFLCGRAWLYQEFTFYEFLIHFAFLEVLGCPLAYISPEILAHDLRVAQLKDTSFQPTPEVYWLLRVDIMVTLWKLRVVQLFRPTFLATQNLTLDETSAYRHFPGSKARHGRLEQLYFSVFKVEELGPGWFHSPAELAAQRRTIKDYWLSQSSALFIWQTAATAIFYATKYALYKTLEKVRIFGQLVHSGTLHQLTMALGVFWIAFNSSVFIKNDFVASIKQATLVPPLKNEGLLGIKHHLYAANPALLQLSVFVLLIALVGVAVLSRKPQVVKVSTARPPELSFTSPLVRRPHAKITTLLSKKAAPKQIQSRHIALEARRWHREGRTTCWAEVSHRDLEYYAAQTSLTPSELKQVWTMMDCKEDLCEEDYYILILLIRNRPADMWIPPLLWKSWGEVVKEFEPELVFATGQRMIVIKVQIFWWKFKRNLLPFVGYFTVHLLILIGLIVRHIWLA